MMISMKILLFIFCGLFMSCSQKFWKTVDYVDRDRFMGTWYVQAGRFTPIERQVHNAVEVYTWNEKEQRIDVDFRFNKGSFTGEVKKLPQKAWIENKKTNAHWKVSPLWPLKFHYLVLAVGADYEWTAIGVPDQGYLWIMTRKQQPPREEVLRMLEQVKSLGYSIRDVEFVPHGESQKVPGTF
jgi:apolipoprotein D and lipocalin family protein